MRAGRTLRPGMPEPGDQRRRAAKYHAAPIRHKPPQVMAMVHERRTSARTGGRGKLGQPGAVLPRSRAHTELRRPNRQLPGLLRGAFNGQALKVIAPVERLKVRVRANGPALDVTSGKRLAEH